MGFAATNLPISYSLIDGVSASDMVTDIDSIFVSVGWFDRTAITGGFQYTISDPDANLGAKVRLTSLVDGGTSFCSIQFLNVAETLLGQKHYLRPASGRSFRIWANCCSVFAWMPEIVDEYSPVTLSGGIPFVPTDLLGDCGYEIGPDVTGEAWWSQGDGYAPNTSSLRTSLEPGMWSACFNGDLMNGVSGTYSRMNSLRLVPMSVTLPYPLYFGTVPRMKFYNNPEPMFFEALLAWGKSTLFDYPARVHGQIYDAVQGSLFAPVDDTLTTQGFDFVNYMGVPPAPFTQDTRFSSLYLLIGEQPSGVRGSYMFQQF